jgi:FixJ family two-component response regulator
MPQDSLICIVDDDSQVRDSLSLILGLKGYDCRTYDSGESFLSSMPKRPACLILDLKMADMSGLDLQVALLDGESHFEIIFLTAYADTEVMRSAFIHHAVDFLEKPVQLERLLRALEIGFSKLEKEVEKVDGQRLLDRLTPREMEVFKALAEGLNHRTIGERLGISSRTVEVHKAHVMDKLQLSSLAELLKFSLKYMR